MSRSYRPVSLGVALLTALLVFWSNRGIDNHSVVVRKVIDGDTVELTNGKLARYIGIDTPETRQKTPEGWRVVNEPFALEAKHANEELVLGKEIRLEFDVQKEDKYKRSLVYCFVREGDKEILAAAELLRRGLAYLYTFPPNVKYVDVLVAALKEARQKKEGLWSVVLKIDSSQASQHIGERMMVAGTMRKVRSTEKVVRFEMSGLNIVIFKKDLGIFEREGISPAEVYRGKNVRVFGLIKEYHGEPEIIVSNPWQVEIVEGRE